ncbi:MAG: ChbG/HpnK family deacetylase [Planctomycetota bacterium]|nr:ChbG/HpnK family deacetylase [Planctomycetota bacterium]
MISSRFLPAIGAVLAAVLTVAPTGIAFSEGEPGMALPERLGFPKDARVLIIHADDAGMCHAANEATIAGLQSGAFSSASVMVPCPWFTEFAAFAREHPEADVGLHLTFTSEWKKYRWGPVAPKSEVPGLLDPSGFFWSSVKDVVAHAKPVELEREMNAQIDAALAAGIKPTHLDSHMGTVFATKEFFEVYLRVAAERGIVPMVPSPTPALLAARPVRGVEDVAAYLREIDSAGYPLLTELNPGLPGKTAEERRQSLHAFLDKLQPGVTQLIIHPASDGPELQAITRSAAERALDAALLSEPATLEKIKANSITVIGWRKVNELFAKNPPTPPGHALKQPPGRIGLAELYSYDRTLPLNAKRTLSKETDAYTLFDVKFESTHDEIVPGLFLLPKNLEGKAPCVICMHGNTSNKRELLSVMEGLAAHGYASIAIDADFHGDRKEKGKSTLSLFFNQTRDAMVQTVVDLRRTIDFLEEQPEIDSRRLGYIGASLGGILGLIFAGVDDRLDAMVSVGGGGSLDAFLRGLPVPEELSKAWDPIDPIHYARSISPTALLMMHCRVDLIVPADSAKAIFELAREPKKIIWYKTGHVMPHPEIVKQSVEWFKEHVR